MSINLHNIQWGWVIMGTVIAIAIAYENSICVVTGYATYLSFEARGAPDMVLINEFASKSATGITSIFIFVGTLVGGLIAGRKAQVDEFQNGLMVGLVSALIVLLPSILGGFTLWTAVSLVLAVGGGWLGGRLSSR